MDFLLKAETAVAQVKKTRMSLSSVDLGAELLVDISRYAKHPECNLLFCFVYDPDLHVRNHVRYASTEGVSAHSTRPVS